VAGAAREDATGQGVAPSYLISDPNKDDATEIDIVDFQSMQSFPASDAPAWPAVSSEPALNDASEQKESPETG
jgi:hypothetical protein